MSECHSVVCDQASVEKIFSKALSIFNLIRGGSDSKDSIVGHFLEESHVLVMLIVPDREELNTLTWQ